MMPASLRAAFFTAFSMALPAQTPGGAGRGALASDGNWMLEDIAPGARVRNTE